MCCRLGAVDRSGSPEGLEGCEMSWESGRAGRLWNAAEVREGWEAVECRGSPEGHGRL